MAQPRTIHDFYGFPAQLYACRYPAPGDPELARHVAALLPGTRLDEDWGLDHGSWSVLLHLYPAANIPVLQLSLDLTRSPAEHFALGRALAPLREERVLLLGTGNVVHNLRALRRVPHASPHELAQQFNAQVRQALLARDDEALIDYGRFGAAAQFSVPTPEHYLPLLYVLGARSEDDQVQLPIDGIDQGALSMLSVLLAPQSSVQKQ
jgi:4,5-DOPA dioxygenase extradiol